MKSKPKLSACLFLILSVVMSGTAQSRRGEKASHYCNLFRSNKPQTVNAITAILVVPALGESRVDGDGDLFLFSEECNNRDYFAVVDLSPVSAKLNTFPHLAPTARRKQFQVQLSGTLTTSVLPAFGHLDWLRAQFRVTDIKAIQRLRVSTRSPAIDRESPRLEDGSYLKFIVGELIFSLFGKVRHRADIEAILTPRTKIIINDEDVPATSLFAYKALHSREPIAVQFKVATEEGPDLKRVRGLVRLGGEAVTDFEFEVLVALRGSHERELLLLALDRVH